MPRLTSETISAGDQSWIGSTHGIRNARSVAPDSSLFTLAAYPSGIIPSGTPLGIVTASGLVGPYTGDSTDEVQVLTVGGSGLTSFTVTYGGQTTASIIAAATAAQVQAALEALSNIDPGDVFVTGSAGGPWTLAFAGRLANADLSQVTATPTGGSGTVTPSTTTAGGADASADGRQLLAGFLLTDQKAPGLGSWPMFWHGLVNVNRLPVAFVAAGHNQHVSASLQFKTTGGA